MKLALITDLHANREAVEAVLAHAQSQGAGQYAFLGDFVGYGADPGWVVDCVRGHVWRGALAVKGNHDDAAVLGPQPSMVPDAREVAAWTQQQLSPAQIDFLASLPLTTVDDERLFVHANAFAPPEWAYIFGRAEAVRSMRATASRITFCGHMHEPWLYHLAASGKVGDFQPTPEVPIPLSRQRQWLAIPGSAGQPRDGNPAACYAMFDIARSELTFFRVPYDHDTAAAKVRAAGLPLRLAQRLQDGS